MEFPDVINKELGSGGCGAFSVAGDEVSHLGQAIHDNHYAVVSAGFLKPSDEVNGDIRPWAFGDWQGFQGTVKLVAVGLGAAADMTVRGPAGNIRDHLRPVVVTGQEFMRLSTAWVAGSGYIVMVVDQAAFQGFVVGNPQAVVVVQTSISFGALGQGDMGMTAGSFSKAT